MSASSINDLGPLLLDGEDRTHDALAEAGRIVFCLARGVSVHWAALDPDLNPHPERSKRWLWPPREADARPGAMWIDVTASAFLAADRALRLLDPEMAPAGEVAVDHDRAVRIIDAVNDSERVESEVDRLSRGLDAFMAHPIVQEWLMKIAPLLLREGFVPADELRTALFGNGFTCGALSFDFEQQCDHSPHANQAGHYVRGWSPDSGSDGKFVFAHWASEGHRKIPLSQRSSMWKRLDKALRSTTPPPRKRPGITAADLPEVRRRMRDPLLTQTERDRATRQMMRHIATRIRTESRAALASPDELRVGPHPDVLERHSGLCEHQPELDDKSVWCPRCGFESPPARNHVYLLADQTGDWLEGDRRLRAAFRTAEQAQTALRLLQPAPAGIQFQRLPLAPKPS